MAGRAFVQPSLQLHRNMVRLYAHITFGASGAPTLDVPNSKGFATVANTGTGAYTLTLGQVDGAGRSVIDTYVVLMSANEIWDASGNSGTAPAAPLVSVVGNSVGTTGQVQITCRNSSGTATNPASGEGMYLELHLQNAK